MGRCKTCGNLTFFLESHKCPPQWVCWPDDGRPDGYYEEDDGGERVYADNFKEAAETFATTCYLDNSDSQSMDVVIKSTMTGQWVKVRVEAEIAWNAVYGDPEPFMPLPRATCPECFETMRVGRNRKTGYLEFHQHYAHAQANIKCLMSGNLAFPVVRCLYCLQDIQLTPEGHYPEHENKGGRRCLMSLSRPEKVRVDAADRDESEHVGVLVDSRTGKPV